MKRLVLASLCMGLFAAVASAADITGLTLTPIGTLELGARGSLSPNSTAVATTAYSNWTNFTGFVLSNGGSANQAGNTITRLVADDITPAAGYAGLNVIQVSFTVANSNAGTVTARPRLRFYLADGAGGGPGTLVAGFSFSPIAFPAGVSGYFFNPGGALSLPITTFWTGMTFDDNTGATGATAAQLDLLGQGICDPPTVGTSADVFFQTTAAGSHFVSNPTGTLGNFSGNPAANFGWIFDVELPVPATPSTWGRVKSLYR